MNFNSTYVKTFSNEKGFHFKIFFNEYAKLSAGVLVFGSYNYISNFLLHLGIIFFDFGLCLTELTFSLDSILFGIINAAYVPNYKPLPPSKCKYNSFFWISVREKVLLAWKN